MNDDLVYAIMTYIFHFLSKYVKGFINFIVQTAEPI